MADVIRRGLGVHQTFHSAREKIMPVAFNMVAKIRPASAEAAAIQSQICRPEIK